MKEYEEEMACLAKFGIKKREGGGKKTQGRVIVGIANLHINDAQNPEEQTKKQDIIKPKPNPPKVFKKVPNKSISKSKRQREKKKLKQNE